MGEVERLWVKWKDYASCSKSMYASPAKLVNQLQWDIGEEGLVVVVDCVLHLAS